MTKEEKKEVWEMAQDICATSEKDLEQYFGESTLVEVLQHNFDYVKSCYEDMPARIKAGDIVKSGCQKYLVLYVYMDLTVLAIRPHDITRLIETKDYERTDESIPELAAFLNA